jgi:hypothetical protein
VGVFRSELTESATVELETSDGVAAQYIVGQVSQRNWSRVASARQIPSGYRVFLKQFCTSSHAWRRDHYDDEILGAHVGSALMGDGKVISPIARSSDCLTLAYPWRSLSTPDSLLRSSGINMSMWSEYCKELEQIAIQCASNKSDALTGYIDTPIILAGHTHEAICFPGLEVRNAAIEPSELGVSVRIFDLGRPSLGNKSDLIARLLVSILLLNWGRPLRRFVLGPPRELLTEAFLRLGSATDRTALRREFLRQVRSRLVDTQGRTSVERTAKRVGIAILGIPYMIQSEGRIRQNV